MHLAALCRSVTQSDAMRLKAVCMSADQPHSATRCRQCAYQQFKSGVCAHRTVFRDVRHGATLLETTWALAGLMCAAQVEHAPCDAEHRGCTSLGVGWGWGEKAVRSFRLLRRRASRQQMTLDGDACGACVVCGEVLRSARCLPCVRRGAGWNLLPRLHLAGCHAGRVRQLQARVVSSTACKCGRHVPFMKREHGSAYSSISGKHAYLPAHRRHCCRGCCGTAGRD